MGSNFQEAAEASTEVTIVGAGPSGLMLACNLVRFGIKIVILDEKPSRTLTGRADGMQPKTIETFRQLGLADSLLKYGVRVYDICFWESTPTAPLRRTKRVAHYPDHVGTLNPYVLLAHQGMLEEVLIEDIEERGIHVVRNSAFLECFKTADDGDVKVNVRHEDRAEKMTKVIKSSYLVGCDGARSQVRMFIPGAKLEGERTNASWGVLDGVIETDFPDLWSKTVVRSDDGTSILWIPRERNMTRLYVELSPTDGDRVNRSLATPEYVMRKAREVMAPYKLEWKSIEWYGNYVVGQRVASHFVDPELQVFIAGDAGHCHSALAAQGANTSMHDSFNLAWKLNLVIRGLADRILLTTYEKERRKIAKDLINFDTEHVRAFAQGDEALARNFDENIRFISGTGAEYTIDDILNRSFENHQSPGVKGPSGGRLKPGALLTPPTRVTRYLDANPVHLQLDIPLLGQFRIYIFAPDVCASMPFLEILCARISTPSSLLSQVSTVAERSYEAQPRRTCLDDVFVVPKRYIPISNLVTYALVTRTPKSKVEIGDLPPLLQASCWTFYLDDIMSPSCTDTYLGPLEGTQIAIVNVRPDGYVGCLNTWDTAYPDTGVNAAQWIEEYYGGFLRR